MARAEAEAARTTESLTVLETNVAKAQERVAVLEREAAAAADGATDADARAAEAMAERTQAQERIATLENEAGQADIRADNAERALQKLKEPRTLDVEQQARITAALTPYAGQEYTLSVASGSEAENLLCAIDAALSGARWKRIISGYRSITLETKCGTADLNGSSGLNVRLSEKADTEHQWNMLMLVNALRDEGIEVEGSI